MQHQPDSSKRIDELDPAVRPSPRRRPFHAMDGLAGVLALTMALSGGSKLVGLDAWQGVFSDFGFPLTLIPVVGVLELLSAILLVPRTSREYGAALALFILGSAVLSHLVNGGVLWALIPAALLAVSGLLMWRSRDVGPNSHPPVSTHRQSTVGSYPLTQTPT